jgi:hypothetical protein
MRLKRLSLCLFCTSLAAAEAVAAPITISVVSSRPDMVSGGDALIALSESANKITLNGTEITADFRTAGSPGRLGLVRGLRLGSNTIEADGARIEIQNYPLQGPIFSGPHEQPFYCMTEKFALPASKETLGPALDADCSIKTRVDFVYRGNDGDFHPLPSGTRPSDLAETTTTEGKRVPYIVRVETGTIDRAIYQTAVLFDPAADKAPTPFDPPQSWNRRLVYTFGGGCVGGWYIQGNSVGNRGILEDLMLRQGYALASSSLNVFGNNCNIELAAEAASMVKEHFIKTFGPMKFTIGWGCSGGSEQQHPIADSFPGLIDGAVVGCSFPDVMTAQILNLSDADLMNHYFTAAKVPWTDDQELAASGYPTVTTLPTLASGAVRTKAQDGTCNAAVPKATQYSLSNPTGVRCDIYDHMANILGRDPATGAGRNPWDNVGVQYGLDALNTGVITKAQFIDLNRNIGGYDNDGNFSQSRGEGDLAAIEAAYREGQITNGGLGLKSTPIIDYRAYVDQPQNNIENHSRFHSFVLRQRLVEANGSAANHVMLIEAGGNGLALMDDASPVLDHVLTQMDQWLTTLDAGMGSIPTLAQITAAKPADLTDACFTDHGKTKIAEEQVYRGNTKCNQLYPAFASPRLVAGAPLRFDVLKCALKPLTDTDYRVEFTQAEMAELKMIFPKGVCDYTLPGVGQVTTKTVWRGF